MRLKIIPEGGFLRENLPPIAREVCASTSSLYSSVGFYPPWVGYLAYVEDECIGACSFKSSPRDGRVEIAYFTFPGFENRGFATRMASELLEIARWSLKSGHVFAQTLPKVNPSNHILKKLGFDLKETKMHPEDGEVWEWEFELK